MEESSGEEWESKKQEHKQGSQKGKNAQARAKAQTYEQLLSKHVKDTKEKAREPQKKPAGALKCRQVTNH